MRISKRLMSVAIGLLVISATVGAEIKYSNPILPYDYSDPDVCQMGDKFIMTSSSFNNCPGLQILQSDDMVHWNIVDAALPYKIPGYAPDVKVLGNMVWAPSIRYHKGELYIYYGDPDRGIYCVKGQIGHWQEPVLVMPAKGYIDPCPLWDEDGRCYLVHALAGSRAGLKSCLLMAELTEDGLGVKVPSRIIFDGHEEHPTCEGPKLYKKAGYYYIMHPAGGVENGWQVVQRSKHIYGPYECKVVLAQGATSINGPHQGGYIETAPDKGWFVHFQDVGVAGRIVHLQPVMWQDGWPVMGNHGEPVIGSDKGEKVWAHLMRRDDFDQSTLAWDWQFPGGYIDPRWYFCDAQKGLLRLYSFPRNEELMPNMLLQKIPAVAFRATCRVRFTPNPSPKLQGAEEAGMVVFGREVFRLPVSAGKWMYLRLEMTDKQVGQFYQSADGDKWEKVGDTFQAREGKWTGAQVGLYCTREDSRINDAGYLDIDWWSIE